MSRLSVVTAVIGAALLCCSCSPRKKIDRIMLSRWEYAPCRSTDPHSSAEPFVPLDSEKMNHLATLLPDEQGYILLRTPFTVPASLAHEDIGVYTGKICIASRVFVNDVCIGTRGRFPPDPFCGGTGASSFLIPRTVLKENGQNEITFLIWVSASGGITSTPFISTVAETDRAARVRTFIMSEMYLLFTATLALISLFYLLLFFHWNKEREYLWYALTNIATAFYMFPYFQGDVPWLTANMSWLLFNKIFVGVAAFVTAYFATSFIRTFLKVPEPRRVMICRLILLAVPSVWMLLISDYRTFWHMLPVLFLYIAVQMVFAVTAVVRAILSRQREIAILLFGFAPVLASVAADFVLQGILGKDTLPFFTVYGWQGTIALFLVILVNRFSDMRRRVEYLNVKLESEVAERTKDLTDANRALEAEHRRAEQDMDLAVHVQRSFYPSATDFPGWDIAVCFQPLSGLSGDLYDFYQIDGKLRGVSLFDVSGHGIAAGLVTMLAKSVIYRTFKSRMNDPLSDVLGAINTGMIAAKGNIENYLTGVLFRYDDTTQLLQLSNAGSPQPVFHQHGTDTAILLAPGKNERQCGMIGMAGIDVSFPVITQKMEEGDCLVCYTDGITESTNGAGEQFGRERLMKSFADAGDASAAKNLACIMDDLAAFTGGEPAHDDITVIVLKRVAEDLETLDAI